jgi:serine/threonine-protein kinase
MTGQRSVKPVLVAATTATDQPGVQTAGPPLTAQDLERATRLLTTYIGPIAKVVTKRAAGEGISRREFFSRLAESLDSEAQRERFLREAGV